ncbi:MAG: 3-deoxy-7-phosphoheptulonate synthase [Candidatus Eisenbacteria bacterium]|nr:3-deoxy-7-phosphoheptulonate synthase [Candidatus Eisenbacteria bacterium]
MIIILKPGTEDSTVRELLDHIKECGLKPQFLPGEERVVLGAIGDERVLAKLHLESHPCVESVKPILAPYKMVSRESHPEDTVVHIGSAKVGNGYFTVIAGPCAIESLEQAMETCRAVAAAGAAVLRGGAFKPRTSPYSFQGLGVEGLEILKHVSRELNIPTVTEVVEVADILAVEEHADAFQVGARNMQNFRLLSELGQRRKPVVLKRGMAATIEDLLMAAEYVVSQGNPNVILCERGIRTFETATRNTLDLNAVPFIKQRSHLPVLVDPSHGTGRRQLVAPMSLAAAAAGADGIIVEVHRNPAEALSDGEQSLYPEQFESLMRSLRSLVDTLGRTLMQPAPPSGASL